MRLDPSFELVKDRTNRQLAFERAEGRLGLGQLVVFLPQLPGTFTAQIRSKQILPFAQHLPVVAYLKDRPFQSKTPGATDYLHLVQVGDLRMTCLNSTDLSLDLVAVLESLFSDPLLKFVQSRLHPRRESAA